MTDRTSTGVSENKGFKKMPVFTPGEPISAIKANQIIDASNDIFSNIINGQLVKTKLGGSGGTAGVTPIFRTVNNSGDAKSTGGVETKAIDSASADVGSSIFKNKFTPYPATEGDYITDTTVNDVQQVSVIGRNSETPLKTIDHSVPTATWNRSIQGSALPIDDLGILIVMGVAIKLTAGSPHRLRELATREFSFDKHGHLFDISEVTFTTITLIII